jgi:hypothetical protein
MKLSANCGPKGSRRQEVRALRCHRSAPPRERWAVGSAARRSGEHATEPPR